MPPYSANVLDSLTNDFTVRSGQKSNLLKDGAIKANL